MLPEHGVVERHSQQVTVYETEIIMRPDQKLDRDVNAIVDDIMREQYKSADDFRSDARAVAKAHGVGYGKLLSLIEAGLKEATESE